MTEPASRGFLSQHPAAAINSGTDIRSGFHDSQPILALVTTGLLTESRVNAAVMGGPDYGGYAVVNGDYTATNGQSRPNATGADFAVKRPYRKGRPGRIQAGLRRDSRPGG